jgi:hypothetical protein
MEAPQPPAQQNTPLHGYLAEGWRIAKGPADSIMSLAANNIPESAGSGRVPALAGGELASAGVVVCISLLFPRNSGSRGCRPGDIVGNCLRLGQG